MLTGRNLTAARTLGAAQLALGASLLGRPGNCARFAVGGTGVTVPSWVVQVLGGRMALQGAVELARPTRLVTIGALTTDALHALSMVALAAAVPSYRRVAIVGGLPALVAAVRGAQIVAGSGSA